MKLSRSLLLRGSMLFLILVIALTQSGMAFASSQPATVTAPAASPTTSLVIDNFEADTAGYICNTAWFCVDDGGAQPAATVVAATDLKNVNAASNQALSMTYTSVNWGGIVGKNLSPAQDWSSYAGISFWFKGSSSGNTYTFVLDQGTGNGKYQATFKDTASTWKYVKLPWEVFSFREGTADGMPLTNIVAYMIIFQGGTSDTVLVDQIKAFNTDTTGVDNFESDTAGYICNTAWFCVDDGAAQPAATVVAAADLKNVNAASNQALSMTYTSVNWGGIVGKNLSPAQDWSAADGVSFWFKGSSSGNTYTFVLDQGTGNGKYQATFKDDSASWKLVALPWEKFSFREGTADGMPLTNIVAYMFIFQGGTSDTVLLDKVNTFTTVSTSGDNFESDTAGYICNTAWFCVDDGGAQPVATVVTAADLKNVNAASNQALSMTYTSVNWGGIVGKNLSPAQDWSAADGVSFWFKGSSSGNTYTFVLDQGTGNGKYQATFKDDSASWKLVALPWEKFGFREGTADGMPLTNIVAYMFIFQGGTSDTVLLDNLGLYGPAGTYYVDSLLPQAAGVIVPSVKFSAAVYGVDESAGKATITVNLSAATTVPVSVDYATSDGTAVDGTDYTAASGTLDFAAGETSQTFDVPVIDNSTYNASKTVNLALSNPSAANLGTPSAAVLNIMDDDTPPDTKVVDDFTGSVAPLYNPFGTAIGFATWGSENGNVQLSTQSVADSDPLALPGQSGTISVLKVAYNIGSWGGFTHALEDGHDWISQDWSRYDGVSFWLYGNNTGGTIQTEIFDNQALGSTGDSAERYYYRITDNYTGWQFFRLPFSAFQRRTDYQPGGAPNDGLNLTEVSGYAFGFPAANQSAYIADYSLYGDLSAHPLTLRVQSATYAYGADEGQPITVKVALNAAPTSDVTVDYAVTADTAVAGINYDDSNATGTLTFAAGETAKTVVITTLDDGKVKPTLTLTATFSNATGADLGYKAWAKLGINNIDTPDASIVDDFENGLPNPSRLFSTPADSIAFNWENILSTSPDAVPGQFSSNYVLSGDYPASAAFTRLLDVNRDLSGYNALRFWYKGSNSGQPVTVKLLDGQPVPAPSAWTLAWSDEFGGLAGAAPNSTYWNHDIGGEGWGNNEWEYYTDSTDNSAQDGSGNLVITAKPNADPALQCANGPAGTGTQTCAYTSARLLTKDKIDFAYGRIEAKIKIPYGQGIWPAFWMLGSDIESNPWPGSGEIDIMENIGAPTNNEQSKIYGTLHGPGYSGGAGIGSGAYNTGVILHDDFHTYAIEWEPTEIRWYFDGVEYFSATPADVPAGKEWVFNKPFFIIMNIAVGGNWPGYPDPSTTFPQTMTVDYVRVYQGPDTAQRFETSFVDDSTSWKLVTLPFARFVPSATQPAGAATNTSPLLTNVTGYSFELPSTAGSFKLDDVRGANVATYNISGNAGVAGAVLSYTDGTAKTVTADSAGHYSLPVTYGWSGTVTPSKTNYTFNPASNTYADVQADLIGEDYAAMPIVYSKTFYSTGLYDGWVRELSELINKGGSLNAVGTTFQIGDDAFNRQYKGILFFNTKLPTGAVIKSATLRIKQSGASVGTNPFTVLGNLLVDIKKGVFGKLALETGDFQALATLNKAGMIGKLPSGGWYKAILGPSARSKVNLLGLTQFRLYFATDDNNNYKANYMKFFSGNSLTGKPELIITYTLP